LRDQMYRPTLEMVKVLAYSLENAKSGKERDRDNGTGERSAKKARTIDVEKLVPKAAEGEYEAFTLSYNFRNTLGDLYRGAMDRLSLSQPIVFSTPDKFETDKLNREKRGEKEPRDRSRERSKSRSPAVERKERKEKGKGKSVHEMDDQDDDSKRPVHDGGDTHTSHGSGSSSASKIGFVETEAELRRRAELQEKLEEERNKKKKRKKFV